MANEDEITRSSGNVFADLGFGPEEAENLRIRSKLMIAVSGYIEDHDMTQAAAAELFGVTQPRISDLTRGKIGLFSIDALVNMLSKAGRHVSIHVETPGGAPEHEGGPVPA